MPEKKTRGKADFILLILVLLLVVFGLVILSSTSAYNGRVKFNDPAYYLKKQLFATALGLMVMYLVSQMDYHRLAVLAPLVCMGFVTRGTIQQRLRTGE